MVEAPGDIDWGTCHNDSCDEPLPADMRAIIVGEAGYCSPACARDNTPDGNADVWLHDPQLHVDRRKMGLDPNTIQMRPPASGPAAIDAIDELLDTPWRV